GWFIFNDGQKAAHPRILLGRGSVSMIFVGLDREDRSGELTPEKHNFGDPLPWCHAPPCRDGEILPEKIRRALLRQRFRAAGSDAPRTAPTRTAPTPQVPDLEDELSGANGATGRIDADVFAGSELDVHRRRQAHDLDDLGPSPNGKAGFGVEH